MKEPLICQRLFHSWGGRCGRPFCFPDQRPLRAFDDSYKRISWDEALDSLAMS